MSLPSSSAHLEYIEDLGFKDSHFLCTASFPPAFSYYQTPLQLAGYFENGEENPSDQVKTRYYQVHF